MSECPYKPGGIYNLRCGLHARIYRNDAPGDFPIHGAVIHPDRSETPQAWALSGSVGISGSPNVLDLRPPERPRIKIKQWVNVYTGFVCFYDSRKMADKESISDRLACVAVEFDLPEGYGLNGDEPAIIVRGE